MGGGVFPKLIEVESFRLQFVLSQALYIQLDGLACIIYWAGSMAFSAVNSETVTFNLIWTDMFSGASPVLRDSQHLFNFY